MTSSTVLGGLDGWPGKMRSRDGIDPVSMLDALMEHGGDAAIAQRIVLAYLTRGVDHGGGDGVVSDASSSVVSSRVARSERFFRVCDEWLDKPGYCYTAILRPSKRSECARRFGIDINLNTLLDLPEGYVAWRRLDSLRVRKVSDSHMHLSFIESEGDESFMAHMASFIGDFPTVVSTAWLNSVRHVPPVEDGWFGLTTIFGSTSALAVDVRPSKALERGGFSEIGILCSDGSKELVPSLEGEQKVLRFMRPTVVLVPAGAEVVSSGLTIAAGLGIRSFILVVGSVAWEIRGSSGFLVCIDFERYERKFDFQRCMRLVGELEMVLTSSLGRLVPYVMFDNSVALSSKVLILLNLRGEGFNDHDLDDVRQGLELQIASLRGVTDCQVYDRLGWMSLFV